MLSVQTDGRAGHLQDSLYAAYNSDTSSNHTVMKHGLALLRHYNHKGVVDSCRSFAQEFYDRAVKFGDTRHILRIGIDLSGMSSVFDHVERYQFLDMAERSARFHQDTFMVAQANAKLAGLFFSIQDSANVVYYTLRADSVYSLLPMDQNTVSFCHNSGYFLYNMRNYELGLRLLHKGNNAYHNGDTERIDWQVRNWLGLTYNALGNIDSSLYYFQEKVVHHTAHKQTRPLAATYRYMSYNYLKTDQDDRALTVLDSSFILYRDYPSYDRMQIILDLIGSIHIKREDYRKAEAVYDQLVKIYKEEDENYFDLMIDPYRNASLVFEKVGRTKDALFYHKKSIAYADSLEELMESYRLDNFLTLKKLDETKAAAEAEKRVLLLEKEQQEQEAQAQIRRQNIILYASAGGGVIMLLFLVSVYRNLQQKKKSNLEISRQKEEIEAAHEEIQDSIAYAKRIQSAILPSEKMWDAALPDSIVLYKPKDVVAGDFFWLEQTKDTVLFAAADCTGHGVPGAMVSVICNGGLNRSVNEFGLTDPAEILFKTRELVIGEFEKSEEEVKDGMDIALCALTLDAGFKPRADKIDDGESGADSNDSSVGLKSHENKAAILHYAGAHNPLWIIRKDAEEVEEIKADKQPIGKYAEQKPFTTHTVELNKGDIIYVFSDGFADQFGGEKGKKFKAKNFKRLLLSIQHETMSRQKELIDEAFENWRGSLEQLDDVCVIGVRV